MPKVVGLGRDICGSLYAPEPSLISALLLTITLELLWEALTTEPMPDSLVLDPEKPLIIPL